MKFTEFIEFAGLTDDLKGYMITFPIFEKITMLAKMTNEEKSERMELINLNLCFFNWLINVTKTGENMRLDYKHDFIDHLEEFEEVTKCNGLHWGDYSTTPEEFIVNIVEDVNELLEWEEWEEYKRETKEAERYNFEGVA